MTKRNGTSSNDEPDWKALLQEATQDNYEHEIDNRKNLKLAGFIFASAVGLSVGLTAPFVFSRSSLPYMATPKDKVKRALQHLGKGKNGNGIFLDLGSGDGEAVYQAAKLGYRATGLELNFTLWAFSSIRRRLFWPKEIREKSNFIWGDMFKQDIQHVNTIMIFGVNPLMMPISQKLRSECSSGTHILSYRFAIPLAFDKQPDLLKAKIIYDEQEMRIYEARR